MKKYAKYVVWVSCLLAMGCGGADEEVLSGEATEMSQQGAGESFVVDGVADLANYSEDSGKADDVYGSQPVLHIEPDGEWHSINFLSADTAPDSGRKGTGAIVIGQVDGPVKISMVVGSVYREEGIEEELMPRWTIGHRLQNGQALVLDHVYRLPNDRRLRTAVPEEDFLNDDFLDEPVGQRDGFNRVELDADQVSRSLQISLSFYNDSDSVRVKVEPQGWHPDAGVYNPAPDHTNDEFLEAEEEQMQLAWELLDRLRQNNFALEEAIEKVNVEISRLQSNLYAKQQRVNELVNSLDRREDELEDERERQKRQNLILCAFGYCQAALLSELMRDDSEYQQIKRDLESARQEQQSVEAEVRRYHDRRSLLEGERRNIQRRIQGLRNALSTVPSIPEFSTQPVVVRVAHQIALARELNTQLKESYRVSLQIRNVLLEIHWVLDGFINDLEEFDAYIADYIVWSRQEHYKLLRKFLDPDFDAEAWLDREFMRRVGRIMPKLPTVEGELNKMLAGFVDSAVKDYFRDPSSPEAKLWRDTVLSSLKQNWRAP